MHLNLSYGCESWTVTIREEHEMNARIGEYAELSGEVATGWRNCIMRSSMT
jgi:hypothetical protein